VDATAARAWIDAMRRLVDAHKEQLGALDAAIGDGDHGVNLSRGFTAATEALGRDRPASPGQVLAVTGRTLISTVGGASGPLYGAALRKAGSTLGDGPRVAPAELARALGAALDAVQQLGAARPGDKTMVDALAPAVEALGAALDEGAPLSAAAGEAAGAALAGAEATIPMLARKGRASYLGERSIGHQDPGATSTALLFRALAALWRE
jgi:dihydroxyacetone kinase-like protein